VPPPPRPLALRADSTRVDSIADGLTHVTFFDARGPWVIHLLDVDLARCWSMRAIKAGHAAIGRASTSSLISQARMSDSEETENMGGVNADFFSFVPPGVPAGAHIEAGAVIVGPSDRPVLMRNRRRFVLGTLAVTGTAVSAAGKVRLRGWNRPDPRTVALIDHLWGAATDTASGAIEVVLRRVPGRKPGSAGTDPGLQANPIPPIPFDGGAASGFHALAVVSTIDTSAAGVAIPDDGMVLIAGRLADSASRARLRALRPGRDTVQIDVRLSEPDLQEAVAGRPMLLRDGVPTAGLDTLGGAHFAGRNPRTAVGFADKGRRMLLVVVDGRQPGYSDGMTLVEMAELFLKLGARDALNLDGGGSSTMVTRAPGGSEFRVMNRPSDKEGERPVGNALAIAHECQE
jgi:hypothetical protein